MSIRDRFREAMRKLMGYDTPEGGIVPEYPAAMLNHPFKLPPANLDNAKAFRFVSTVFACITRKSADLAAQPVVIERESGKGWEPVKRAPGNVVDVWHAGNPEQTGMEVVRDLHANLLIHGNAYLVAETFGGRRVKELWVMPSHLVEVVPGPRRGPKLYLFSRGGIREAIPAENVIHFRAFQPDDEPIGMSALESVREQYEARHQLMKLMKAVIENGGTVAGYMSTVERAGAITAEEKRAMADSIRRARRDPSRPVILDNLKFERMGLTPAELQFIETASMSDADICRALGVPPWLIGIKEGAKLGDSGQSASADERIYWMGLRTELEFRDRTMTERLLPMFAEQGNTRFRTDLSAVPALNAPLLNAAQQAVALAGRPVLTVNEVRRLNALPPVDDPEADELYQAPAPQPFGMAPAQPAGPKADPNATADNSKPAAEPEKKSRLLDTPERAERWRGKDRLMRAYESKFLRGLKAIFRDKRAKLLSALETQGVRALAGKRAIDLDAVFTPDDDDMSRMQELYEDLIAARGAEAAREVALELELNLQSQKVQDFIRDRRSVGVSGTLDTFMQDVRLSLAEGVGANESLTELASRVADKFDTWENGRALTIARTETVSAFNFASVEAWSQTGDVEKMEWLSARDSAVRETHAEADGQTVQVGSPFEVGGANLLYPGDPAGGPAEVINCRCTVMPIISERARARRKLSAMFSNGVAK